MTPIENLDSRANMSEQNGPIQQPTNEPTPAFIPAPVHVLEAVQLGETIVSRSLTLGLSDTYDRAVVLVITIGEEETELHVSLDSLAASVIALREVEPYRAIAQRKLGGIVNC